MNELKLLQTPVGIKVVPHIDAPFLSKLPAGVYSPKFDENAGLILSTLMYPQRFDVPSKIYGSHMQYRSMVVRALQTRERSVGVLLTGYKGSGKTILMHDLCNLALDAGHPVFVIDRAVSADGLRMLYKLVNGECVFLFDEFDKTYDGSDDREKLLAFFSDRDIKKALFLLSLNKQSNLPDAYVDRTGRFLYRFEYAYLTREVAGEILNDYVLEQTTRELLLDYVDQLPLNIDTFIELVQEIERFGEGTDLDLLFSTLNIARPKYLNTTVQLGINPDTPIPAGWTVKLVRKNLREYLIVFDGPSGEEFVATEIEIEMPLSGSRSIAQQRVTYPPSIMPTQLSVYVRAEATCVPSVKQYRQPIFNIVDYVKEEEKS